MQLKQYLMIVMGIMLSFTMTACSPSQQQLINKTCSDAGYKEKAFEDCVSKATEKYEREVERKRQAEAKTLADADRAKCKGYGFKSGADAFATCMQKLQKTREQEQTFGSAMREFQEDMKRCNFMRSLDTGSNSDNDLRARIQAAVPCSDAQAKGLALGLDISGLLIQQTARQATQPKTIDCDRFGNGFSCTEY